MTPVKYIPKLSINSYTLFPAAGFHSGSRGSVFNYLLLVSCGAVFYGSRNLFRQLRGFFKLSLLIASAAGLFFQEHAQEHEHDIADQHGGHKDLQTDELGHCIAHSRVARHIIEVSCHLLRSYHTDGHREGKSRKSRIELEGEEIRELDKDEQE